MPVARGGGWPTIEGIIAPTIPTTARRATRNTARYGWPVISPEQGLPVATRERLLRRSDPPMTYANGRSGSYGPMAAGDGLIPQHGPFKRLAKTRSPVREKPLHYLDSTCWDTTTTQRCLVQQQRRAPWRRVGCAVAPRPCLQLLPTPPAGTHLLVACSAVTPSDSEYCSAASDDMTSG